MPIRNEYLVETELFGEHDANSTVQRSVFNSMDDVAGYVRDLQGSITDRPVHLRISTRLNVEQE